MQWKYPEEPENLRFQNVCGAPKICGPVRPSSVISSECGCGWTSGQCQSWNRVLKGSGGHSAGKGHMSVCQTRSLTRFWVLICALIAVLFVVNDIRRPTIYCIHLYSPDIWEQWAYTYTYNIETVFVGSLQSFCFCGYLSRLASVL